LSTLLVPSYREASGAVTAAPNELHRAGILRGVYGVKVAALGHRVPLTAWLRSNSLASPAGPLSRSGPCGWPRLAISTSGVRESERCGPNWRSSTGWRMS
jgi:hypothetical protein